jgi:hypothetical protein
MIKSRAIGKDSSVFAYNETNLMHYLSSVYSVTIPLHDCQLAWLRSIPTRPADSRLRRTTRTNCCIYALLPHNDGQLASPKHIELYGMIKPKVNSASAWFHYTRLSRCTVNKT